MGTAVVDLVTGIVSPVAVKAPCRLATTGPILLTGLQTIDGSLTVEGDRVVVKDMADPVQNGIYNASAGPWVRSPDADDNADFQTGTRVNVTGGSTNAGDWQISTANPVLIGSSLITWTTFTSAGLSAATAAAVAAAATATTQAGNAAISAAAAAASAGSVIPGAGVYLAPGGTANALTITPTSAVTLADKTALDVRIAITNTTTTPTANASATGAKVIRKIVGGTDVAVAVGDLQAGALVRLVYSTAANSGGGAWIADIVPQATQGSTFSDAAFAIQDNGDATKQLAFQVAGITTGNKRTATPPNSDFTMAALDVANQQVTGGARVTSNALGTIASGTVTLDPGTRPIWDYTNNGAHTLAPGTNVGSILMAITNGAAAGAVALTGWTKVVGAFDTTSGHKFTCSAVVSAVGSLLTIQAMQ